ncbi:type VI secretion protein [Pseudomonas sp. DTU12.3]|uniref:type VI secretion system Vgr family protein n=1 Tax=Pseudomonas sp. DTU12.3 TaxID=2073078 RepID=UPI001011714E|nr:contractile injection system protein, VgrG/Pvc8 family [Pseudomonas sp. DTU12.3]QAX83126.1 type VI secretion protein [Pseudomonas sp. DTU12.3]
MFDPFNESLFRLDVAGLSDPLEVLAFTGNEALSEPFAFEIDVLIDDAQLDLAGLLYRSAFLCFGALGEGVHGQLQSLVQHEYGHAARLCRVRLGPRLSCLGLRFSQRIFSGRSVPQILDQVLREHGIVGAQRRFECRVDHPVRTFCTQYHESDLQLLQRLCRQARIHYHFEHRPDGHCLVFGDDPTQLPQAVAAVFCGEGDGQSEPQAIHQWRLQGQRQSMASGAQSTRTAEGCSELARLRSGRWLALSGHPLGECNRRWLLNRIEHHADQLQVPAYSNRIFALEQSWVAASATVAVRQRMHSLQRAWVVAVDEPRPDQSRPVAVQFDWSYQGEGAADSHCWLPMSPTLAEAPMNALAEGVEVVVSFFEGDPDQPMITGVLQVAAAPVADQPLPLPPQTRLDDGLQRLLQSAEPLMLLCLMPGGGSFVHCSQAVCTCRLVTSLEQSGGR